MSKLPVDPPPEMPIWLEDLATGLLNAGMKNLPISVAESPAITVLIGLWSIQVVHDRLHIFRTNVEWMPTLTLRSEDMVNSEGAGFRAWVEPIYEPLDLLAKHEVFLLKDPDLYTKVWDIIRS